MAKKVKITIKITNLSRLDGLYQQGYKKIPETPEIGEAQLKMLSEILPKEKW